MSSLRRRVLWMVMALLFIGTLAITLFNYHDSRVEVAEIYDAQLAQQARLLQGIMHMPLPGDDRQALFRAFNEALGLASKHSVGHPYESKLAFQVWDAHGENVVRSVGAPIFHAPLPGPGFHDVASGEEYWRGFALPDEQQGLLIWVGERSDVRDDLVQRIVLHTLGPNLFGTLVLAALVWWAIGWGLEPLQNLVRVIRGRHAESLEPLQLSPLPRELEPMQAALNRLLSQIGNLLQREHRFIADAAHEMRTPLAVLRLHAQNALQAGDPEERRQALEFLIGGVDRLSRVVNQLLTLARMEPELARRNWQAVDLEAVASSTLAELAPWIFDKGLEVSLEVEPGSYLTSSDASAIGIALQNLVTNAANFSPPGGEVRVSLALREGQFILGVDDQGPGIDEERLTRLFERFYSQDNPQGAGLGLAIVDMIARRLGGQVDLHNRAEGGLRAALLLPRNGPRQDAAPAISDGRSILS